MQLKNLLLYNSITVQCHNFPDADTIASAFALHQYLSRAGKKVRLLFGGASPLENPVCVDFRKRQTFAPEGENRRERPLLPSESFRCFSDGLAAWGRYR